MIHEFRVSDKFKLLSLPLKDKPNVKPVVSWIMEQNVFHFLSSKTLKEFDEVLFNHPHYSNRYQHLQALFFGAYYQDQFQYGELIQQLAMAVSMDTPGGDPEARNWSAVYDQLIPSFEDAVVLLKANKHIVFAILIAMEFGIGGTSE